MKQICQFCWDMCYLIFKMHLELMTFLVIKRLDLLLIVYFRIL